MISVGKKKVGKKNIKYIPMGAVPGYVGVCLTKKAFKKELRRLRVSDDLAFISRSASATTHCFERKDELVSILMCLPKKKPNNDDLSYLGIIVHEASHVVDYLIDGMGEEAPGGEFRAYTIQYVFQSIVAAISDMKTYHGSKIY